MCLGPRDAGWLRYVDERAVAGVAIEQVLAAWQTGRAAGDWQAFVPAETRRRHRRRRQIEVDVVRREEIEPAVAVEVEERTSRAPPRARLCQAGFRRHVLERAVSEVSIQVVLAIVGHEQIDVAVVVVVARARALAPAARRETCARRHVFEGAIALVAIQVIRRLLSLRKTFEHRAVDEEDVEPSVFVIVEHGRAAAGGFEQVLVGLFSTVDSCRDQARLAGDVGEREAERVLCAGRRASVGADHHRRYARDEKRGGPVRARRMRLGVLSTVRDAGWRA